jgi:hypothetical protein
MPKGSYTAGGKSDMPKKVSDRMRDSRNMERMGKAVDDMRKKMKPRLKGKDGDPFIETQAGSISTVKKAMGGMIKKPVMGRPARPMGGMARTFNKGGMAKKGK